MHRMLKVSALRPAFTSPFCSGLDVGFLGGTKKQEMEAKTRSGSECL